MVITKRKCYTKAIISAAEDKVSMHMVGQSSLLTTLYILSQLEVVSSFISTQLVEFLLHFFTLACLYLFFMLSYKSV